MPKNKKSTIVGKNNFILLLASGIVLLILVGGFLVKKDQTPIFSPTKIPQSFPPDFPVYPKASVAGSWLGEGASIVWETKDSFSLVKNFYKSSLLKNGWSVTSNIDNGNSTTFSFEKDGKSGFMGISGGDETQISVTFGSL